MLRRCVENYFIEAIVHITRSYSLCHQSASAYCIDLERNSSVVERSINILKVLCIPKEITRHVPSGLVVV